MKKTKSVNMGTSISHYSTRNTNWKPVLAGYLSGKIPESRVLKEIWRASEKEPVPISSYLKSKAVYECYRAVKTSKNFDEALGKFRVAVQDTKSNSIVAEFAKRVIPVSFQSKNPAKEWQSNFFSELTTYIVSRDLSGFVGDKYRNKSVKELISFKQRISSHVRDVIKGDTAIKSSGDWESFVQRSIDKLKGGK